MIIKEKVDDHRHLSFNRNVDEESLTVTIYIDDMTAKSMKEAQNDINKMLDKVTDTIDNFNDVYCAIIEERWCYESKRTRETFYLKDPTKEPDEPVRYYYYKGILTIQKDNDQPTWDEIKNALISLGDDYDFYNWNEDWKQRINLPNRKRFRYVIDFIKDYISKNKWIESKHLVCLKTWERGTTLCIDMNVNDNYSVLGDPIFEEINITKDIYHNNEAIKEIFKEFKNSYDLDTIDDDLLDAADEKIGDLSDKQLHTLEEKIKASLDNLCDAVINF